MKKKLDRKELWHFYLRLCLVTIFYLNRYLGVFAATIIFLIARDILTELTGNFVAEQFNIFEFASTEMQA